MFRLLLLGNPHQNSRKENADAKIEYNFIKRLSTADDTYNIFSKHSR